MFRFSAGSAEQTWEVATCKRSKIGTFLNAGWRCGGGYLRGRDLPVAPLRSASFGPFLAETRKGRTSYQLDKLKFEYKQKPPGAMHPGVLFVRKTAGTIRKERVDAANTRSGNGGPASSAPEYDPLQKDVH